MAASVQTCKIHPVALCTILDAHERRNEDVKRVIGTLLGSVTLGVVEVTNCFAVPHHELEDEVSFDLEYAKNMCDLHQKVNPSEQIVGWFATGQDVNGHSLLIHDYYSKECKNPVHVTVDPVQKNPKLGVKAFVSVPMGCPGGTMGTMFIPRKVNFIVSEPESVAVGVLQRSKLHPKRHVTIEGELKQVSTACSSIRQMLEYLLAYVDNVISGKEAADSSMGRQLMQLVDSVPSLEDGQLDEMMNSSTKDLLMVTYLSKLTSTQLMLNEKLHLIANSQKDV